MHGGGSFLAARDSAYRRFRATWGQVGFYGATEDGANNVRWGVVRCTVALADKRMGLAERAGTGGKGLGLTEKGWETDGKGWD